MFLRYIAIAALAFLIAPKSFSQDCEQEDVAGDWQFQLTRVAGEDGLGLRCTLRVTPSGRVAGGSVMTFCDYASENTPNVTGEFTVTDAPTACLVDVSLRIFGGPSGNKAFLRRQFRLNEDRDAASWYDGVLENQRGEEIFSGPISLYKY